MMYIMKTEWADGDYRVEDTTSLSQAKGAFGIRIADPACRTCVVYCYRPDGTSSCFLEYNAEDAE